MFVRFTHGGRTTVRPYFVARCAARDKQMSGNGAYIGFDVEKYMKTSVAPFTAVAVESATLV